MRTVTNTFNLYRFDELTAEAKERAIDYADGYYFKTGFDCRYDEVALLKNI